MERDAIKNKNKWSEAVVERKEYSAMGV